MSEVLGCPLVKHGVPESPGVGSATEMPWTHAGLTIGNRCPAIGAQRNCLKVPI